MAVTTSAELYGLVLAGGLSTRMGTDKAKLSYHGLPQWQYLTNVLATRCVKTFISTRDDRPEFQGCQIIKDVFDFRSPLNGILSAIQAHRDKAWLVLAVDMPYVNEAAVARLVAARNPRKFATSYLNPLRRVAEPLLTIWEPHVRPQLEEYIRENVISPQWILNHLEIELVTTDDTRIFYNVNRPEDWPYRSA